MNYTRAETIEMRKQEIQNEIDTVTTARDSLPYAGNTWLALDAEIDRLLAEKDAVTAGALPAQLFRSESEVPEITEAEQAFEEKCKKFDWAWFFRDSATPKAQEALMNEAVAGGISFVKIYENYRIRKQNPYCRLEKFLEQKFEEPTA